MEKEPSYLPDVTLKDLLNAIVAILIISFVIFQGTKCKGNSKPDKLYYKSAQVLDIKRDDESQYHLLVRYSNGITESIADAQCTIRMGDYKATAELPFAKWDTGKKKGTVGAWEYNSTSYSRMKIKVYLPLDYNIKLFND